MEPMDNRIRRIMQDCLHSNETDPVKLFYAIAAKDFVRIHGPEHHFLDGACILTAFHNAGGNVDLKSGLEQIAQRSVQMPGAMCGHWGVCGAVTSIGAALSVIDTTGPLSEADWGRHMLYTSAALANLAKIGGPRCCKRDAFLAMQTAIEYINKNTAVTLPAGKITCVFSHRNAQCLNERCPFYAEN